MSYRGANHATRRITNTENDRGGLEPAIPGEVGQCNNGTVATGDNRTVGHWTQVQWTVEQQDNGQWDNKPCDNGAIGHLTMGQ
jgi:hypothetical protein